MWFKLEKINYRVSVRMPKLDPYTTNYTANRHQPNEATAAPQPAAEVCSLDEYMRSS